MDALKPLAGDILDNDHPLSGAIKGGIGAMMAEVIAESLVDRQQIQNQVTQELGLEESRAFSPEEKAAYEATYREKLHPAMNTANLVVASVKASFGHDPSIAIAQHRMLWRIILLDVFLCLREVEFLSKSLKQLVTCS